MPIHCDLDHNGTAAEGSEQGVMKYLTERMQPMARTGYFFHLRKGRSTEYAMPSKRLPTRVANKGAEPM